MGKAAASGTFTRKGAEDEREARVATAGRKQPCQIESISGHGVIQNSHTATVVRAGGAMQGRTGAGIFARRFVLPCTLR